MLARLAAAAFALALVLAPALARAETGPRPVRVAEIVSIKVERLKEGGDNTHRLIVVGKVPSEGWSKPMLRPIKERHPNNAVAGFEMVATPPKKGEKVAKTVTELTATLETT